MYAVHVFGCARPKPNDGVKWNVNGILILCAWNFWWNLIVSSEHLHLQTKVCSASSMASPKVRVRGTEEKLWEATLFLLYIPYTPFILRMIYENTDFPFPHRHHLPVNSCTTKQKQSQYIIGKFRCRLYHTQKPTSPNLISNAFKSHWAAHNNHNPNHMMLSRAIFHPQNRFNDDDDNTPKISWTFGQLRSVQSIHMDADCGCVSVNCVWIVDA